MDIYVINLDKSSDRLEKISRRLYILGYQFNRFPAVDGKKLTDEEIEKHTTWTCRNLLCNRSVIGCALSHYTLWKNIASDPTKDDNTITMILEDDVLIPDDFREKLGTVLEEINSSNLSDIVDIVYLYCAGDCQESFDGSAISLFGKFSTLRFGKTCPVNIKPGSKMRKAHFPLTFTGYLITKRGAKKAIASINDSISYHIDYQLASTGNLVTLSAPILGTDSEQESTIGTNRFPFLFSKLFEQIGASRIAWALNIPALSIKLDHTITIIMLIYAILLSWSYFNNKHFFYGTVTFIALEYLLYILFR